MAVDKQAIADFGGDKPKYYVSIDPTTNRPGLYTLDADNVPVQVYLYATSGSRYKADKSIDSVIKTYEKDFKAAGTTQKIWDAMYAAGDVTKKEYTSKDASAWLSGLKKYITSFSIAQARAIQNGATSIGAFSDWFSSAAGGGSTTATSKTTAVTKSGYESSQAEADNELNLFFMDQIGRNATPEERKNYLALLNAEEAKVGSTRTATTTSTSTSGVSTTATKSAEAAKTVGPGQLSAADHTRIMSGVLATAVKNMDTKALMASGGAIAQGISDLQAYAGEYGLRNYNADMAKNDLVTKLAGGASVSTSTLDGEKLAIRAMAKTFYPGLASLIDQGVRVSSIGNIYTNEMQKILELPSASIDWANDPYISKALQNQGMDGKSQGKEGALNLNDFAIMLRNDPRWSKTQNAREEAAGYANSILRSFGLAG